MPRQDEEYGICVECERLLPLKVLRQIKLFKYHSHKGAFHHKLLCFTCRKMAREAGKEIMKDKKITN